MTMTNIGTDFRGKVVLITGAGRRRGQGAAEARKLEIGRAHV